MKRSGSTLRADGGSQNGGIQVARKAMAYDLKLLLKANPPDKNCTQEELEKLIDEYIQGPDSK